MTLEAIERVTEVENQMRECRITAEAEARQLIANAERDGLAMLQKMRAEAAEKGKILLRQAEERAAERAAEIQRSAEVESAVLCSAANGRLEEAAEFIVGRVVSH